MNSSPRAWLPAALFVAAVFAWSTASLAAPIEVPDFLFVRGKSVVKVKKVGKSKGLTDGRLDFIGSRCALQLSQLFTLTGDCAFSGNNKRVLLTPDPWSAEEAVFSFLDASVFKNAVRGAEDWTMKVLVKLKQKNDEVIANVAFRMKFVALLALAHDPQDPGTEVVKPIRFKYTYHGKPLPPE